MEKDMYATELAAVVESLQPLVGEHRGKIWQPSRDQLVIEVE